MTIDRDDPERHRRASRFADDVALCEEVSAFVGNALLREGLSPRAVEAILQDAIHEFCIFRQSVTEPHAFLVKRIYAKAEEHRKLRGIEPRPDPNEQATRLLDVIRTRAALETLSPYARRALEILYYENGSYDDVAAELNMARELVPRFVQRALDRLRKWRG